MALLLQAGLRLSLIFAAHSTAGYRRLKKRFLLSVELINAPGKRLSCCCPLQITICRRAVDKETNLKKQTNNFVILNGVAAAS